MKLRFYRKKFSASVRVKMFTEMNKQKRIIGLREFAKQINISASTLSRIYNDGMPDIETFFKLCNWMEKDSNEFHNYKH